jgi:hypothetical protein
MIDLCCEAPDGTIRSIPDDACMVREFGNWAIYHSVACAQLYFYPTDYHPDALALSLPDMHHLMERLKLSLDDYPGAEEIELSDGSEWYPSDTVAVDASRRWMDTR